MRRVRDSEEESTEVKTPNATDGTVKLALECPATRRPGASERSWRGKRCYAAAGPGFAGTAVFSEPPGSESCGAEAVRVLPSSQGRRRRPPPRVPAAPRRCDGRTGPLGPPGEAG